MVQRTLREIENIPCWLLVADIRGFTPLSRRMQSEDLDVLLGAWIFTCKEIIENQHGIINKYLGDGFLAYWPEAATTSKQIVAVISALKELQRQKLPEFRFVVHFGAVAIGGSRLYGRGKLDGRRIESDFSPGKTGWFPRRTLRAERSAHDQAKRLVPVRALGEFELKGFETKCAFFAL